MENASAELSLYISWSLSADGPPAFQPRFSPEQMPPDTIALQGVSALIAQFHKEAGMDEAWKRGVFCPLGAGVLPFPAIVETLRGQGYSGWMIVEQDVVPDAAGRLVPEPFESARKSRAYLREKVGL